MAESTGTANHWDAAYAQGSTIRSWFQADAYPSLRMLELAVVDSTHSFIDIGGGSSTLADALLDRGHSDVTVLDVSVKGLRVAQERLGERAQRVHWLVEDVLSWTPRRTWKAWHDRAVLHFFTRDEDRRRYVAALNAATPPGAISVIATFAPDGPTQCSGLTVARYDATQLSELLGPAWTLVAETREEHTTPTGVVQPFTWAAFRRSGS
jgi:trans-aconitate methyltransferase